MWVALILFILVAIDASALVCYITRFTEENFATLIAFIFIFKVSIEYFYLSSEYRVVYSGYPYTIYKRCSGIAFETAISNQNTAALGSHE